MVNQGVIPSVMDELFSRVEVETNTDFTVKVSFVEIHKVGSARGTCTSSCSTVELQQIACMQHLQCTNPTVHCSRTSKHVQGQEQLRNVMS